jgi:ABC-type transporter Mla maintaining outer membrane lipid asymmetry ATPase subunit MlaF
LTLDPNILKINDNVIFITDENISHNGKIIEIINIENNIIDFIIELKSGELIRKNHNQLKFYYKY